MYDRKIKLRLIQIFKNSPNVNSTLYSYKTYIALMLICWISLHCDNSENNLSFLAQRKKYECFLNTKKKWGKAFLSPGRIANYDMHMDHYDINDSGGVPFQMVKPVSLWWNLDETLPVCFYCWNTPIKCDV